VDVINDQSLPEEYRVAVDIGSTVIKIAKINNQDVLLEQKFYPRDFATTIADQVESLLDELSIDCDEELLICSSANGGLRVGIISLTEYFSGMILRNQVLLAGANPVFLHRWEDAESINRVDILLVGGGIDCADTGIHEPMIRAISLEQYQFSSLLYAGNKYLADLFSTRFPQSVIISNPLGQTLVNGSKSVFEFLRRAYLDDLVYKEGVTELRNNLSLRIRPTPEVVHKGFQRIVSNQSSINVAGSCLLFDIGGATTDIHYTVEIVRDDSPDKPMAGVSTARYVFTDLGVVASQDSTTMQLRSHPKAYEFLTQIIADDVRGTYQLLREGEYVPTREQLSYACLFLGLDRFSEGKGPGLPVAELNKVSQIILTGGATQDLDMNLLQSIVGLFFSASDCTPKLLIDSHYQVWIDGITWRNDIAEDAE